MPWLVFLLVSLVTYSVGIILQRILLKDTAYDPVAYAVISGFIGGIALLFYLAVTGITIPSFSHVLPNILLMACAYGIANILVFRSLRRVEASTFTVLFASRVFWTIAAAVLLLHEQFGIVQSIGAVLILGSVLLASWRHKLVRLKKEELYALLAALVWGIELVNDSYVLRTLDAKVYAPLFFILPNFIILLVCPRSLSSIRPLMHSQLLWKIVVLGLLGAVSAMTYFMAYEIGRNAAQIATINQVSTVLTVLLAIVFLRERVDMVRKLVATVVGFIGLLLVV